MADNTSRLWEPLASEDALAGIFAYDDSETRVPAPQDIPVVAKVVWVVVGIAAFLLLLVVLVCAGDGGGSPARAASARWQCNTQVMPARRRDRSEADEKQEGCNKRG